MPLHWQIMVQKPKPVEPIRFVRHDRERHEPFSEECISWEECSSEAHRETITLIHNLVFVLHDECVTDIELHADPAAARVAFDSLAAQMDELGKRV